MSQNEKIFGGGFHHLALRVRDFDKSLNFYTSLMGFINIANFPHPWDKTIRQIAMLDTGDGNYLEIFSDAVELSPRNDQFFHVAFRTRNVDAAIAKLRTSDVEISLEPQNVELQCDPLSVVRIAYVKGPDGEEIELIQSESGIMF